MRIRIRDLFDPGSGMEKFGSEMNIPDPQYWSQVCQSKILAAVPPPPPATELIKPVELAALTPTAEVVLEAATACCRLGLEVCRVEEFTLLMRLLSTLATLLSTAGSVRETTTFEYL